jgi:hypothetical protein
MQVATEQVMTFVTACFRCIPSKLMMILHQVRVFGKAFASSLDDACVVNCDDEADFGSL